MKYLHEIKWLLTDFEMSMQEQDAQKGGNERHEGDKGENT